MEQTNEICCLCLTTPNTPVTNLFFKSGNDLTYIDKLSSSLCQLANILNENKDYDFKLCAVCCCNIEMIYKFNRTSLNNVEIFLSQKRIVKVEPIDEEQCWETNIQDHSNFFVKEEITNLINEKDDIDSEDENTSIEFSNISHEIGESSRQNQLQELKNHMRSHSGIKVYKCDECGKDFFRKEVLKQHKLIHKAEKPWTCNQCGKRFKLSSNLSAHKRVHSGEKPYECDVCKKTFSQKQHLMRHRRIHTGERPYSCNFCTMKFSDKSNFNNHLKRVHKD